MAVYEFDMLERFLENAVYLDIQSKCLLLAQTQCLVMFTLKLILKNVQSLSVTSKYVQNVVASTVGIDAMLLASQVALDLYLGNDVSYLLTDKDLSQNTNICSEKLFRKTLQEYISDPDSGTYFQNKKIAPYLT